MRSRRSRPGADPPRLALFHSLRKRHAVRELLARMRSGFAGAGRGAFLRAPGPVDVLKRDERGNDGRAFEELAIGLACQACRRPDALAVEEYRVAQHRSGGGDPRGYECDIEGAREPPW